MGRLGSKVQNLPDDRRTRRPQYPEYSSSTINPKPKPTGSNVGIFIMSYKTIDTETGEINWNIKYLTGSPRQYRFNAQSGEFTINGDTPILGKDGKKAKEFTLQPIAFRFFRDRLFGRENVEDWAELFFVDASNVVSGIMFNNTNASELRDLLSELFYEDLRLNDIVLTCIPEKKEGKKGNWYICKFEYTQADKATVLELEEFDREKLIFRRDTITQTALIEGHGLAGGNYFTSLFNKQAQIQEAETVA